MRTQVMIINRKFFNHVVDTLVHSTWSEINSNIEPGTNGFKEYERFSESFQEGFWNLCRHPLVLSDGDFKNFVDMVIYLTWIEINPDLKPDSDEFGLYQTFSRSHQVTMSERFNKQSPILV